MTLSNAIVARRARRRWPILVVLTLLVLSALWTGVWYYGAGVVGQTIDGWRSREAQAGRVYTCASQTIGGFPFGIEVRCADAGAQFNSNHPPVALKTHDMLVSASLWQPTTLTTEFTGPLTIAEPGQPAKLTATWDHAQSEVHGLPSSPESVSLNADEPVVEQEGGDRLFKAAHMELNGRLVSGTVEDNPVIEVVLKLVSAAAPSWHPAAAIPVNADITATLRGLKDFSPKPWPQRFRELQAAGGRIDIRSARIQQRETVAVASGSLGLSPAGRLNGQLDVTVANLERFLPELHLDQMLSQEQASPQVNNALGALDKMMPGLGNIARKNAGAMISASVNMMGRQTQLEGQRAVMLPLRFDDGMVSLGAIKLGSTPALF